MTFLFNPNGDATVMHLADHNRFGAVRGALCGEVGFSRSCNLPLGQPRCVRCQEVARDLELGAEPNGDGLLALVLALMADGVLSEGQVATASGLDRVDIRRRADELAEARV